MTYKMNAANKLYKDSKNNLTQKELILKSYARSAEFISRAIESLNNKENTDYVVNTNKAITIIQNMLLNLNYFDPNGNKLVVAENLHAMYIFILDTLRKGLKNKNTNNFNICISHLNELYDAFEKTN